MNSESKTYIDPFEKDGGSVKEEQYTPQMKYWIESIELNSLFLKNPKTPNILVRFINNSTVNGTVLKIESTYYIGIFLGFIYVMNDLFFRMLSSPNILTAYGDPSKEE